MNVSHAEQNLAVIRTLMERSALYRRALAPIFIAVGCIGIITAVIGIMAELHDQNFLRLWVGAALVSVTVAVVMSRRQANQDGEAFLSGPTRRVLMAFLPPALVGGVMSAAYWRMTADQSGIPLVITYWLIFYGCSLHAVGMFTPRAVRWLGWIFIVVGATVWIPVLSTLLEPTWTDHPHFIMGATFGGLHLLGGLVLKFTQKGSNVE